MPYNKKIKTMQDVLLNSFSNSELKYKFIVSLICKDWQDIIGEPLCHYTKPVFISKNILHVACMHGGIIQTLNFKSTELTEILKTYDYHYNIEGIKFIPYSYKHS